MPKLGEARYSFRAIWLPSGRIFAFGGLNEGNLHVISVEMLKREWNCAWETDEAWQPAEPMLVPRSQFAAVALRDEAVLIVGGLTTDAQRLSSVDIFTPPIQDGARGQWTSISPTQSAPTWAAGVFYDGAVFILGTLAPTLLI